MGHFRLPRPAVHLKSAAVVLCGGGLAGDYDSSGGKDVRDAARDQHGPRRMQRHSLMRHLTVNIRTWHSSPTCVIMSRFQLSLPNEQNGE
jgi:hypothetical protein